MGAGRAVGQGATQTWEHYLFVDVPYLDYRPYEYRKGSLEIHQALDGYVIMTMEGSSCEGQQSLFELFDLPSRDVHIGRLGSRVALAVPANTVAAYGVRMEEYREHLFGAVLGTLVDLLLAPLTPEFWQAVVTGPYFYEAETTAALFTELSTGARETCLSEEGLAVIDGDLQIPEEIKILLDL